MFCARLRRRAYSLVELFVTIAILIIVLGLMVDLANRVRRNSSDRLTRQLLQQLTALMDNYLDHNGNQLPPVTLFLEPGPVPDEAALQSTARRNNADLVRFLRGQSNLTHPTTAETPISDKSQSNTDPSDLARRQDIFAGLPLSLYDEVTLHDPWGSPIIFMPHQHPLLGMAPGDKFFFFSAGPDRKFLSREDNLYSYEESQDSPP